jgi:hypothetical protein
MLKLKSFQNRELLASFESIKVKPSTMLLAFGGVLLFAYLVVGASYIKERQEQSGLTEQIQAGGGTLSGTGDSQQSLKDLQDRLTYMTGGLESLQNAFPTKLDSPTIVQGLLDYANQSHVAIRQMNALPASKVAVAEEGEPSYTVLRYTLVVEGGLQDMLSFLSLVENGTSQTAAIGDASIVENEGSEQMVIAISFYSRSEMGGAATTVPGESKPN